LRTDKKEKGKGSSPRILMNRGGKIPQRNWMGEEQAGAKARVGSTPPKTGALWQEGGRRPKGE